jgi:hypothetical protein
MTALDFEVREAASVPKSRRAGRPGGENPMIPYVRESLTNDHKPLEISRPDTSDVRRFVSFIRRAAKDLDTGSHVVLIATPEPGTPESEYVWLHMARLTTDDGEPTGRNIVLDADRDTDYYGPVTILFHTKTPRKNRNSSADPDTDDTTDTDDTNDTTDADVDDDVATEGQNATAPETTAPKKARRGTRNS